MNQTTGTSPVVLEPPITATEPSPNTLFVKLVVRGEGTMTPPPPPVEPDATRNV
jgi:hypothetical protein